MPPHGQGDEKRPVTPNTRINLHAEPQLPASPSSAASVGLSTSRDGILPSQKVLPLRGRPTGSLIRTVSTQTIEETEKKVYLQLKDGTVYEGFSFGAERSAAGELVFQTGMVGYPESITDPSYRGQLLVLTFPLAGNYGVPSRKVMDEVLMDLPKYFESNRIHITGLIVGSYCGEDFSHHLAVSSLGKWLKENHIPAMHGIDTRALTRYIRESGSILGRMLHQEHSMANGVPNGDHPLAVPDREDDNPWVSETEWIEWIDPNVKNLVQEGMQLADADSYSYSALTKCSLHSRTTADISPRGYHPASFLRPDHPNCLCRRRVEVQPITMSSDSRRGSSGRAVGL
jgi:carbamoyl-phosphate synthase / aspartate carbamoyltransferase